MVDAASGRNISGDSVDRLPVYHECPAGMATESMGTRHQLVVRPEFMVLDRGDIQDVPMANGADGYLAHTLGAGTAKTDDRFGTLKTILSQIV